MCVSVYLCVNICHHLWQPHIFMLVFSILFPDSPAFFHPMWGVVVFSPPSVMLHLSPPFFFCLCLMREQIENLLPTNLCSSLPLYSSLPLTLSFRLAGIQRHSELTCCSLHNTKTSSPTFSPSHFKVLYRKKIYRVCVCSCMLHVSLWFFFVEMTVFKWSEAKWNCFIALFFIFFIFTTFSFNVSSNLLVTKEKCVNSLNRYILKWWIIVAVFWTVRFLYWFLSLNSIFLVVFFFIFCDHQRSFI